MIRYPAALDNGCKKPRLASRGGVLASARCVCSRRDAGNCFPPCLWELSTLLIEGSQTHPSYLEGQQ
jgi:hypothetical protein